jgi:hypothetical protein
MRRKESQGKKVVGPESGRREGKENLGEGLLIIKVL